EKKPNLRLALLLLFAIFLWGGNNTGTKYILRDWPPIFTGATRFLLAGLILLVLARRGRTRHQQLESALNKRLWLQGGLSLAAYILAFNFATRLTPVSHVALYLGASPVWA